MSLVPYDPFKQLSRLRKEFDHFFTELPSVFDADHRMGSIRVDIHETEREVIATCDIPGLEKKDDVDINIENNMLHISGTINRSNEMKEENVYRKERYVGRFQRSISLPSPVSHVGVKASYQNGVLQIKMPKTIKDDRQRIDIDFH